MKKSVFKTIIVVSVLFVNMHISNAQNLYAISQTSDNMDFLSTVNPMTGSTTIISSVGLALGVAQGISTIDPINKRFFFMSSDTFYTADLITGNLLAKNISSLSPTYSNYLFEFNCQDSTLYAISQTTLDNMDFLSKIDPMTGSTAIISPIGLAYGVVQGESTIDPINKRFFFISSDTLYTVDLITGNLLAKNISSLSAIYSNHLFEFNWRDSTLYAISQKISDNMDFLSKVDPMTGSTTIISPVALAYGVVQGVSTLDPINKRFFFKSSDTLYTVDLISGNLLYKNISSLSPTYSNYLFEFEESCPSISIGIENQFEQTSSYQIFPNPFLSETTLQSEKILKDATLTIHNSYGQQVNQIKNINGQTITLHRDNLPSGLYFLRLMQDNKIIITFKVVITD